MGLFLLKELSILLMHAMIYPMKLLEKPSLVRSEVRKNIQTIWKEFSISILIFIPFSSLDLIEWIDPCTIRILYIICLCWLKPPWFFETILRGSFPRKFSIILVKILHEEFHKEIGLNLEKEEGLVSFGMRSRKYEFMLPPTYFFFIVHLTILHK